MFMQLNVTSSDTIIYCLSIVQQKKAPKPTRVFVLFSLREHFPIFLNLCIAVQLTVYMKIYSLPWGRFEISREATYKWQGGESDLIDWLQALRIKIGKAYREEESWFLLGEALCSPLSFLYPFLFALVSLVPFFVLPMLRWCYGRHCEGSRMACAHILAGWFVFSFSLLPVSVSPHGLQLGTGLLLSKIGSIPVAVW